MGDFYGTRIEIWAGFGPVGTTEKKIGSIMSNFSGRFFDVFMGKKKFKKIKNILAFALKKLDKMKF